MNPFAFLLYSFALYIGHLTEFSFAFYQSLKLTILLIEVCMQKVEGWRLKFHIVYFYFIELCCFMFGFHLDNGDFVWFFSSIMVIFV